MRRRARHVFAMVLLVALAVGERRVAQGAGAAPWEEGPLQAQQTQVDNLLVNGDMEDYPFYWEPPNHWVAGGWMRWWMGSVIPEYDDVRDWRPYRYDGDHAQIYFWVWHYTAGIYQRVAVQPCTFYRFSMYGRNHSAPGADHHARIGIDPLGRQYNTIDDPAVSSLPADITWSPEQTFFYDWGLHSVTAESRSDHVTAITYVSPDPDYAPYDTFWDAGTLAEALPPDGRLPAPESLESDGFITNVITSTSLNFLLLEWDTPEPASTQVWYTTRVTSTASYTGSVMVYLPLILNGDMGGNFLPYTTFAHQTPVTHHEAVLGPFQSEQMVEFVALSRHLAGSECRTSASGLFQIVIHVGTVYDNYIPLVLRSE